MKSFTSKKIKGFSLVELIIYIAILAVFSVAMVNTLLLLTKSWTTIKISKNISISATSALERMAREIRNSTSIDIAQSTFNTHPGQLTLNSSDSSGGAVTYKFFLTGDVLKIKKGSATADSLTLSVTPVTSLVFRRIVTSESEAVRVEMQVQNSYRGQTSTQNFYTTASLRGGYQN